MTASITARTDVGPCRHTCSMISRSNRGIGGGRRDGDGIAATLPRARRQPVGRHASTTCRRTPAPAPLACVALRSSSSRVLLRTPAGRAAAVLAAMLVLGVARRAAAALAGREWSGAAADRDRRRRQALTWSRSRAGVRELGRPGLPCCATIELPLGAGEGTPVEHHPARTTGSLRRSHRQAHPRGAYCAEWTGSRGRRSAADRRPRPAAVRVHRLRAGLARCCCWASPSPAWSSCSAAGTEPAP